MSSELLHFLTEARAAIQLPLWLRQLRICLQCRRPRFDPWVRKIPWRRKWQPTPVSFSGESHGQRSLVDYSPQGRRESDMTEQLHFHFHYGFMYFFYSYYTPLPSLFFMLKLSHIQPDSSIQLLHPFEMC